MTYIIIIIIVIIIIIIFNLRFEKLSDHRFFLIRQPETREMCNNSALWSNSDASCLSIPKKTWNTTWMAFLIKETVVN